MPNLEQLAVTDWFAELRPEDGATWPPAVRPIETSAPVRDQLAALGTALDGLAAAELPVLRDAVRDDRLLSDLRAAMAQLGAARTLRLLHWLAEMDLPDCHEIILRLTEGQEAGACAVRATIDAVTRAATMRRMFAPERIAALELACTTTKEASA